MLESCFYVYIIFAVFFLCWPITFFVQRISSAIFCQHLKVIKEIELEQLYISVVSWKSDAEQSLMNRALAFNAAPVLCFSGAPATASAASPVSAFWVPAASSVAGEASPSLPVPEALPYRCPPRSHGPGAEPDALGAAALSQRLRLLRQPFVRRTLLQVPQGHGQEPGG